MHDFHSVDVKQVYAQLKTSQQGLTDLEASQRREKTGPNALPPHVQVPFIMLLLRQFNSWFIYILLIAAVISYFFSKTLDAHIILAIVIVNALIGLVQEHRAERAMEALKNLIVPKAKALRNGIMDSIPAADLVVGDVIALDAGDRIPADARIITCRECATQEASLTGESFVVPKKKDTMAAETTLADRANIVWMGTNVVSGNATAVVVATGVQTAVGQIATSIKKTKREKTHFRLKTDYLAFQLGMIAVFASVLTFVLGYWYKGLNLVDVLTFSVATLISSIPEGLPAVLAVVLAVGAYRMAQKGAIVRHLPIIEDLSVASVIMTDKTGTLTQNTMTARVIVSANREIHVSGEGWKPQGTFFDNERMIKPLENSVVKKLLHIAILCNNAVIHKEGDRYEVIGDPTEAAAVILAEKAGLAKQVVSAESSVIDQMPFSQATRIQSVLVEKPEREIYVLGAAEIVLQNSTHFLGEQGVEILRDDTVRILKERFAAMTHDAMRVIACASRRVPHKTMQIPVGTISDLVFVGFIGIVDPIRPEAPQAIQDAQHAGIRVIMVTGDHANTARAVAGRIGLSAREGQDRVYTGDDIQHLSSAALKKVLQSASVFARMTPELKLRAIELLQEEGHTVAMIGDGVNDAPALKKANVGIAMGTIGTDVARESSDIILSDDNFATLIAAIEQGRLIFNNIRKTSFFMISTSLAEIATIIVSIFIGSTLPLTAIQILWINLMTDGIPNLALATEGKHENLLDRPPRKTTDRIISRGVIPFLVIIIALMASATLITFKAYLPFGVEKARTMAFALMVFFQLFNVLNMRSLERSLFDIGIFSNKVINWALVLSFAIQIAIMVIPATQAAFGLSALSIVEIFILLLISLSIIGGIELYKFFLWRILKRRGMTVIY